MSEGKESEPRLSVVWRSSEFVGAVTTALWSLRVSDLLTDVTLSCLDGSVRAHRVLLAACSPYLRNLFQDNPCHHPVLIFRDLSRVDLAAILHFMYHGEVSVPQRRLASFLAAADLLQVRGLTRETPAAASDSDSPAPHSATPTEDPHADCASPEPKRRRTFTPTTVADDSVDAANAPAYVDICDADSHSKPKSSDADNTSKDSSLPLDNSSEETDRDGDEVKFRCRLCWKSFKHPISLSLHRDSHTGKTQCPVCRRFFSRSYDMRCHLTKIHQDQPPPEVRLKVTKTPLEDDT